MKLRTTLSFGLIIFFTNLIAQDFRNVKWGDSPDIVKKTETAESLRNPNGINAMEMLTYLQVTDSGVYYTYTYMFHDHKLIGIRVKTGLLSKENTRFDAIGFYNKALEAYKAKYKNVHEENVQHGLKKFSIVLKEKKIFGEIKEDAGEYFFIESFQKPKTQRK